MLTKKYAIYSYSKIKIKCIRRIILQISLLEHSICKKLKINKLTHCIILINMIQDYGDTLYILKYNEKFLDCKLYRIKVNN